MLFGSLIFLLGFLPLALAGYHGLRLSGREGAAKWFLAGASLAFYGWWDWHYLGLITVSIAANFTVSRMMERAPSQAGRWLGLGVTLNLALLAWYKYAGFLASSLAVLTSRALPLGHIVLPLAISFFTFQQIAYLIESRRDGKAADSFVDYALFVLFFPHLIAGPITHHKEMLPQFARMGRLPVPRSYITVGTAIFILGLAKKAVLADTLALVANPVFDAVRDGGAVTAVQAWAGALAYTLQLYFDFSGYSDMAIGLGLFFGILLPVNFASPYKATSIIEFWRRWHISLSRFLRNYLYFPLGGSRAGPLRRYANLLITMLLGGLWHGAGWTFIAWGGLHGLYLVANHLWRAWAGQRDGAVARCAGWALTMLGVIVAWVLFRASSFAGALTMLRSMAGLDAVQTETLLYAPHLGWLAIGAGGAIALGLPNALELVGYPATTPGLPIEHDGIRPVRWRLPALPGALALGSLGALAFARLPDPGIFLYFTF